MNLCNLNNVIGVFGPCTRSGQSELSATGRRETFRGPGVMWPGGLGQSSAARVYCASDSQTLFGSVKVSIAVSPCSRPKPESPEPPQGRRTSVYP